jgi:predicted O-methyltransferase YrrM
MRVATAAEVQEVLQGFIPAAALGAALELGLFWSLSEHPQAAAAVAQNLSVPSRRCRYWLEILRGLGLLQVENGIYSPTLAAHTAILDAHSQESWAQLAEEWRERFPAVRELSLHIREPGSTWRAQGLTPPDYLYQIRKDPVRARRLTRLVYELHLPLAEELAQTLPLRGVKTLLDVGGGSGVVSLALLQRAPELKAVVIDIENVCAAGREIAAENGLAERISYRAADFLQEQLPAGFDLVIECDVGEYESGFLRKLGAVLNPGGRLVVVDQFAPAEGVAPTASPYLHWAFLGSLADPDAGFTTADHVRRQLAAAGLNIRAERTLSDGWQVIEADR